MGGESKRAWRLHLLPCQSPMVESSFPHTRTNDVSSISELVLTHSYTQLNRDESRQSRRRDKAVYVESAPRMIGIRGYKTPSKETQKKAFPSGVRRLEST
ncbi:hypothetical protein V2J09_004421 [Rumex salicifolius]